jgi:DNA polymerase-3 subunit chi
MVQVDFHFNAPEKWPYVCRLLRKGSGQGKRMGVWVSEESLKSLDQSLWLLNATDFVSHCLATDSEILCKNSSIILGTDWLALKHFSDLDIWVNLTPTSPVNFDHVKRLIEVVGPDESDKTSARLRWKQYTQLGFTINRYDLAAQTA